MFPAKNDNEGIIIRDIAERSIPGILRISRNVVAFLSVDSLTATQMNLLVAIIDALQKSLVFESSHCLQERSDILVRVHWNNISRHHNPRQILESIQSLMNTKLVYKFTFDGLDTTGVTCVISSAKYHAGYFVVNVPSQALPWYLYCGKGVGFAKVERDVFQDLTSVHEKRLYAKLMAVVDDKAKKGSMTVTVEELRNCLGMTRTPYAQINAKVLIPLAKHLNEGSSKYKLSIDHSFRKTGRKGRPEVDKIPMNIILKNEKNDPTLNALNMLVSCSNVWCEGEKRPMHISNIVKLLGDEAEDFVIKCRAAEDRLRRKEHESKKIRYILANTVAKILRENFDIGIFPKLNPKKGGSHEA